MELKTIEKARISCEITAESIANVCDIKFNQEHTNVTISAKENATLALNLLANVKLDSNVICFAKAKYNSAGKPIALTIQATNLAYSANKNNIVRELIFAQIANYQMIDAKRKEHNDKDLKVRSCFSAFGNYVFATDNKGNVLIDSVIYSEKSLSTTFKVREADSVCALYLGSVQSGKVTYKAYKDNYLFPAIKRMLANCELFDNWLAYYKANGAYVKKNESKTASKTLESKVA